MKIFVTGATGFIGFWVAYRLLESGHDLVVLARNPDKLPALSSHPRVRRITATLYEDAMIREGLTGCDACVHVALGWGDTPLAMLKTDTAATASLLEACIDAKVGKFIYTSSTAAMGAFSPTMNERTPTAPTDYYGATKAASEAYVLAVAAKTGMSCNVIRPGYTFGNPVVPGATTQPDRRFRQIAEHAARGEEIVVRAGDGTQFVSARDLARLYEGLLSSDRSREIYFGLGVPFVSWQTIAEEAIRMSGSPGIVRCEGVASKPCLFDLRKIKDHFGLEFSSHDAIREHLSWLLASFVADVPKRR